MKGKTIFEWWDIIGWHQKVDSTKEVLLRETFHKQGFILETISLVTISSNSISMYLKEVSEDDSGSTQAQEGRDIPWDSFSDNGLHANTVKDYYMIVLFLLFTLL